MPAEQILKDITKLLQNSLGLELIGFDLIVDSRSGDYLIIDVNYWPSFKGFENFSQEFLNFIVKRFKQHK